MGWFEFNAACLAFFLTHSIPVRPPVRPWLQARLGQTGFTVAYSLLSLAALGWIIGAAGRAPHVPLWPWAPWHNHLVLVLMLPVCLLLALSIARPNPLSFGGARNADFDPARAGVVRLSRHPLLLALALWAAAHVLPNGDVAHVVLFGTFALFAVFGGRLVDRRKRREMGPEWQRTINALAAAPLTSALATPAQGVRLVLGAVLYTALIAAHPHLFGVSPLQ
ncbi:NnrU family protein [Antarctobacter sp.]|uniref:NnrU family protein n=1 Tax=Antarctobacter sp. TaxID=1872577 RepID=UPI003A9051BC